MKIVIEIPDSEASFIIKLLKSFSFIKKVKTMSDSNVKLWDDLKEAAEQ